MSHQQGNESDEMKQARELEMSSSSSSETEIMSIDGSCVSSEEEEEEEDQDQLARPMVLVGCPRCLMYVMLSDANPKCPKCKSTVLLDFLNNSTTTTPST